MTFVNPVIVLIPNFLYFGKCLVSPRNLEPITISAVFSIIGCNISLISFISCWPSASKVTKISQSIFLVSLKIVLIAEPYPSFVEWLTTIAPISKAIDDVESEEPSSQTRTLSYVFLRLWIIGPIFFSSLNAGIPIIIFNMPFFLIYIFKS